ncbi:MAG: hypothetical protein H7A09_06420 [Oceanospirillaceae bacterium]|nr:hypothetical protein [Oceanospirillaceae bacterium]MCP5334700.1 hypothetical protein [Oceanospirillaceae bacterium]MCP5351306.1 hypothetical protein [Oceanospirillaceae bacterium]
MQKYRLGTLLICKGYITEDQLDAALAFQLRSGKPLGESLIELGFISEKTLHRNLKRQDYLRLCAACMACVMAPLQFCMAEGIEDLPEYAYTQVADAQFALDNGISVSGIDMTAGVNLAALASSTAWYLYQGGSVAHLDNLPVKMQLQPASEGYQLNLNVSF